MKPGWRIFLYLFGLLFAAGGVWLCVLHFQTPGDVVFGLAGTLIVALGLLMAVIPAVSKLVLTGDELTVYELLGPRRLHKEQLAGRRIQHVNGAELMVLVPLDGKRNVSIPSAIQMDSVLDDWIASLPDLDAQEAQSSEQELLDARPAHLSEAQHQGKIGRARILAHLVNGAGVVSLLWLMFWPEPYVWAVLAGALVPFVAVLAVATSSGLMRFDAPKNSTHPHVLIGVVCAAMGLMLRALFDHNVLDGWRVFTFNAPIAVLVSFLMWLADRKLRGAYGALIVLLFMNAGYGYGVTLQANALLDDGQAELFEPVVVGKHYTSGKTTTYHLALEPWGPETEEYDAIVSGALYNQVEVGDTVLVELWPGALGIRWTKIGL